MSEAIAREMMQAEATDWLAEDVPAPAEADVTLDVSGQICPMPGIRIIRALEHMEPGQIIEVRPNSKMFSVTSNINLGRRFSLLLELELLDQSDFEEHRFMTGLVFRF